MKTIYLDNAATTPTLPEVVDAMRPYWTEKFYNPSANYYPSYEVRDVIEHARETIAGTIGCESSEIFFTSGGTESDNWALSIASPGDHIITSAIEHHAILNKCKELEKIGVEVTYLPVDHIGMVNPQDVEKAIKKNTILISIMAANNEIGIIHPYKDIAEIAKENRIFFHTDAVQYYGHYPINVRDDCIDMMSASAHKFGGPKGIGFLRVSKGAQYILNPLIYGGHQQNGFRAGTENVQGIVGMAKAAELAYAPQAIEKNITYLMDLKIHMLELLNKIQDIKINSTLMWGLANNINVSFSGIRGEQLQAMLGMQGIYVSTGSACNSSSKEPSHVLKAIGLSDDEANSSIRFSLSTSNTIDEIEYVAGVVKQCVSDLRGSI